MAKRKRHAALGSFTRAAMSHDAHHASHHVHVDAAATAAAPARPKLTAYQTSAVLVPMKKTGSITSGANFPMDAEGRVYHLGVKHGEGAQIRGVVVHALTAGLVSGQSSPDRG